MGGVTTSYPFAIRRTLSCDRTGYAADAKVEFSGSDMWGKLVRRSLRRVSGPMATRSSRPPSAGRFDANASVNFRNLASVAVRSCRRGSTPSCAPDTSTRKRETRAQHHRRHAGSERYDLDVVNGGVRVRNARRQLFEGRHSHRLLAPSQQLPRGAGRHSATQHRPYDAQPEGADDGCRRDGRMVEGHRQPTVPDRGFDWRLGRRRQEETVGRADRNPGHARAYLGERSKASVSSFKTSLLDTPRLTLTLAARVDCWRNYNAHNLERNVPSGTPTANYRESLPERDDVVASPRAAALIMYSIG